jgi:hypothetical protein
MRELFVLVLVATTSAGLYVAGRHGLKLGSFRPGLERALETIGMSVLFFGVNIAVAVAVILGIRSLGYAISMYMGTDPTLMGLSVLQAVVFQFWRYGSDRSGS